MANTAMLTEAEYQDQASRTLHQLMEALDELEDLVDAELAGDILNLEFADGATYVINSHRAARQIWMAADRQAWHFDYDPENARWFAAKQSEELWATLSKLLSQKIGRAHVLAPATLAQT
ncbi:MAG: hypothetical protein RJA70_266 [Pseudomonadota bacterium]|jgi:CyaY protein